MAIKNKLDSMYGCAYTSRVELEWDRRKAELNLRRHGIDFADAATALHDEVAVTLRDDYPFEERYVTIGIDALGRTLVVVYTWRGERARLISARKATPRERRQYEVGS